MKQFAAILFSSFYLLSTIGVGINFHYCLGELAYVEVMGPLELCCCGEEEGAFRCCEDESYFFQLDTEQQVSQGFRLLLPHTSLLSPLPELSVQEVIVEQVPFSDFPDIPPPRPPIWLSNCSLTYYG